MTKFVRKSREERCLEIRNAALTIFLKKGYRATTMEDIVGAVHLSKGSVYKYYPEKHLILTDLLKDGVNVRNKIISEYVKNKERTEKDFSEVLSNLFFSGDASGKYAKIYVIFLYEKMFDKKLEAVYQEIMAYGIKNTKYINVLARDKIMEITTIMNTLILGKFILGKEFETFVDKDLINSFFSESLNSIHV